MGGGGAALVQQDRVLHRSGEFGLRGETHGDTGTMQLEREDPGGWERGRMPAPLEPGGGRKTLPGTRQREWGPATPARWTSSTQSCGRGGFCCGSEWPFVPATLGLSPRALRWAGPWSNRSALSTALRGTSRPQRPPLHPALSAEAQLTCTFGDSSLPGSQGFRGAHRRGSRSSPAAHTGDAIDA